MKKEYYILFIAPIAFMILISSVFYRTDVKIVFEIPTDPNRSETAAMANL